MQVQVPLTVLHGAMRLLAAAKARVTLTVTRFLYGQVQRLASQFIRCMS